MAVLNQKKSRVIQNIPHPLKQLLGFFQMLNDLRTNYCMERFGKERFFQFGMPEFNIGYPPPYLLGPFNCKAIGVKTNH